MWARRHAVGNAIPGSEGEPVRTVGSRGHGFLCLFRAVMICDSFGDTANDAVPVFASISVSCLFRSDNSWSLGDIPLLRKADLLMSFRVDFTTIQTQCRELSLAVPNIYSNMLGWHHEVLMRCRIWERLESG